MKSSGLSHSIAKIITDHTYIGFTTGGHTAEDVMLAVYHPQNYRPGGVIQNSQINDYMREIWGNLNLDSLTAAYYCRDSIALKGFSWNIDNNSIGDSLKASHYAKLIIRKNPKSKVRAEINAYTDFATIYNNNKEVRKIQLNSIVVFNYIENPKNKKQLTLKQFYCPRNLPELLRADLK